MLSVDPGHIKFSQPGLEVACNLNDLYSQGFPKDPTTKIELPTSLNDPYIICKTRDCPKLPWPGPEVVNNPNELYDICMPETTSNPSLGH